MAVVIVGIWFIVDGWGEFTNTAAIAGFAAAGFVGALLVLPLSPRDNHFASAGVALIAAVTPSGFAYLPNLLMLVVLAVEVRLALLARSVTTP